jgi:predicted small lipoprotein YifL
MKLFTLLAVALLTLSVAACAPAKGPAQYSDNPRNPGQQVGSE